MRIHPTLRHEPCDILGGEAVPLSGREIQSHNPADPERVLWAGSPVIGHVDRAVDSARKALSTWASWPFERRTEVLRSYQKICQSRNDEMAELICDETGKALWDSRGEAGILGGKVDITLDDSANGGLHRVTGYELALSDSRQGRCLFKPHGVMAVIGPYNFPAHLPNGHIIPALAMGNTVVFKPSEKTPAVGQALVEMLIAALDEAGAPAGVVNLVQGGPETAMKLTGHAGIDGVLFTGSWPVGRKILEANLDHPGRMVALELGGNNPAVVMPDAHLEQAAIEVVRAAFVTTGQRCTCTRRLVVHRDIAKPFISAVCRAASELVIGHPKSEEPVFMGPIISAQARDAVLAFQDRLAGEGAEVLLAATGRDSCGQSSSHTISPGVLRVDRFVADDSGDGGCDVEVFGPLLRIAEVGSLDEAIEQANATRYGLAASIFTTDADAQQRFVAESRAGCININTGTAGASSKLPFGGLGLSGNHRPAGSFSLDYCAVPVASMVETSSGAACPPGMRFDPQWLK